MKADTVATRLQLGDLDLLPENSTIQNWSSLVKIEAREHSDEEESVQRRADDWHSEAAQVRVKTADLCREHSISAATFYRLVRGRATEPRLTGPNQEWAMDFVTDGLATGRMVRILSVVDDDGSESGGNEGCDTPSNSRIGCLLHPYQTHDLCLFDVTVGRHSF